jgi:hypothetical protein
MVVDDFYVGWPRLGPSEADSELLVDSNTVLAFPDAFQRFEAVSGRYPQVFQGIGLVQLIQLPSRDTPEVGRAGFRGALRLRHVEYVPSPLIGERLDHA